MECECVIQLTYNNLISDSDMNDNPYAGANNRNYYDPPYQNLPNEAKSDGPLEHLSDGLAGQARTAFIGKVYSLLSLELLITFSFCLLAQYSEGYRNFQLDNLWVLFIPIGILIVTMIVALCVKAARRFPMDMVLLLFFILSFSYIISFCCSAVVDANYDDDYPIVPIAIAVTVGITLALTAYAFLCKGNFLAWVGILLVLSMVVFVLGISSIFVHTEFLILLIIGLIVLIYGIYLVIITKLIIGDKLGNGFPLDSYVIASVFLYIYIMRIFLYILALVGAKK